jgi:prepilin-type processing-associated H-X9-DG protein
MAATANPKPLQFRVMHLLVWTAVIAVVLAVVIQARDALEYARETARASVCSGHFHQLRLALVNYHDVWKCSPPPHYDDATGKPMHSWRILICPYLDHNALYKQYDFSEPWNGPMNSRLAPTTGLVNLFMCPSDRTSLPDTTNYVAVTGPGTAWHHDRSFALTDGTSDLIMLVEISNSNIHWMEPRDLPIEELEDWLDPDHPPRLFSNHAQGGHVLFADGRVEMLSREETIERLRAMAASAGRDGAAP